jgi:hypothetical protein
MNLEILLQSSSGETVPWPGGQVSVSNLSWALHGGPETALVEIGPGIPLEQMAAYLGWKLLLRNRYQTPIWWGFIETITASLEGLQQVLSLEGVANRVAVRYLPQSPGAAFGMQSQTPWLEDPASQATFGVKEKILQFGSMGEEEALVHAQSTLAASAFPKIQIRPGTGQAAPALILHCSGHFKTLAWRHYRPGSSLFGNMPAQSGNSPLGMEAACLRLAQSFKPSAAMQVSFVALRLRKIANPTDNLLVQIQSDNAGKPSGSVLASASVSPAGLSAESYEWLRLSLGTELNLDPALTYWLVNSRSGALSASNGFAVGLDQALNFWGGTLRKFNQPAAVWEALNPEADLLFKVGGLRATSLLMAEVFEACGQKLSGLSLDLSASPQITCLDDQQEDGLTAMRRLLDLGDGLMNPLFAAVSPEGRLRVAPLSPDLPTFHLGKNGKLLTNRGFPIEEALSPVGSLFTQGFAQTLIRHASLDLSTSHYQLQA